MAEIFGSGERGCFTAVNVGTDSAEGAQLTVGHRLGGDSGSRGLLVTGYDMVQREAVSFSKTFGRGVHTYAFGHDPANSYLTVQFVGALSEDAESTVRSAYRNGRISENQTLAVFSPKPRGISIEGYVVGLSSNTMSTETFLQNYKMHLAIVKAH